MPARGFLEEPDEILALVAAPSAIGAQFDDERNRLCVAQSRI